MERLLTRKAIAAMMGTSSGVAASILAKHGVFPIDFGVGRGRGPRWLESAVRQTLFELHADAQPKTKRKRQGQTAQVLSTSTLVNLSVNSLWELTQHHNVQ